MLEVLDVKRAGEGDEGEEDDRLGHANLNI